MVTRFTLQRRSNVGAREPFLAPSWAFSLPMRHLSLDDLSRSKCCEDWAGAQLHSRTRREKNQAAKKGGGGSFNVARLSLKASRKNMFCRQT